MALLKDNPDGTKSGYKRPRSVQQIFSRSIRWETSLHHTTPEGVEVANEEIEPVNASQAAHDRMELRRYAQDMERRWFTEKCNGEKYLDLQRAKEKTVEGLKEELRIKEQEYDGLQIWVEGAKKKIAHLENKLEEGVCHKCRERERIVASLPQDGSRGQKDAWDELLDRISTLEHERNAAQNEINKLDGRLKNCYTQNDLRGRHLTILERKLEELGVNWRELIHESKASDPRH